jgi:hypothetical protein
MSPSSTGTSAADPPTDILRHPFLATIFRFLAAVLVFTAAAVIESWRLTSLLNTQVWLHLRTGTWILHNWQFPRVGLFTQAAGAGWAVPSWGFDVASGLLVRGLGLRAIPALSMLLSVLTGIALFGLALRCGARFSHALVLSAVGQLALGAIRPEPIPASIVFFAIELGILLESRRTGSLVPLYFLPACFVVWSNVDHHFVLGVLVLILYWAAAFVPPSSRNTADGGAPRSRPLAKLALLMGLAIGGTLLNPYGIEPYRVAAQSILDPVAMRFSPELHALPFRQPGHFIAALLCMGAFFTLGRERSRDLFKLALLACSTALAFRMAGEAWVLVVVAVGVIGDACWRENGERSDRSTGVALTAASVVASLCLALGVLMMCVPRSDETLSRKSAEALPVEACAFIAQSNAQGPLFNAPQWGNFATWRLPDLPPSLDQRFSLYGEEAFKRYSDLTAGRIPLEEDPAFANANVILIETDSALAKALRKSPEFALAHEDRIAVVFLRKRN